MSLLSTILLLLFMFMLLVIWNIWDQGLISIEMAVVLWVLAALAVLGIAFLIDRTRNG